MSKTASILALLMFLLLSACGLKEKAAEVYSNNSGNEINTEIEIVIENGLEDSDLSEIWIDPSEVPWSDNLLHNSLAPGEEFIFVVSEATEYDIQIINEQGDTYTIMNQSIDEEGFEWEVVYEDADWNSVPSRELATVTIENGLRNQSIWYLYGTYSSSDEWGSERLGYMVLEPGESFSFDVTSENYYDFYARNSESDFYFSLDNYIDDDGLTWMISRSDLDNSTYEDETHGASTPITVINRLGNVRVLYAYENESGGESWGPDLLEGDVLEAREEFTFYLPADRFYDFHAEDEYGNAYTVWEVPVKDNGICWEVIRDDMDE